MKTTPSISKNNFFRNQIGEFFNFLDVISEMNQQVTTGQQVTTLKTATRDFNR
jgi:hypothetical protein